MPKTLRSLLLPWLALLLAALLSACSGESANEADGRVTLVFKHFKMMGDPGPLDRLIAEFEQANPGIRIRQETLPASSDEQHQFYTINLQAGSDAFDVLAADVIWMAEFAAAGWLHELDRLLP